MQSIKMYHHVNQNSLSIGYIQIQTQVVQKQVKPYIDIIIKTLKQEVKRGHEIINIIHLL
jgi:hypothetical protein